MLVPNLGQENQEHLKPDPFYIKNKMGNTITWGVVIGSLLVAGGSILYYGYLQRLYEVKNISSASKTLGKVICFIMIGFGILLLFLSFANYANRNNL